ncbi:thioesterase family protein [Nocardioides sp. CFH 31398]|uniref:acyl-CoA thioesterase n=1 Tax=Nocardioides sp. CFH 31398 TaxID=2919579 RepID=UPI001F05767A|nr:thioesterase family protein [Nocardioides sp. CFH 31398]MCH1867454.1 acyl-CoA thioesterase [Nocardioides sp. CFH 31398]
MEQHPVWRAPVRYAECDQQGVVFNAHYLTWADETSMAWFADVVGLDADDRGAVLDALMLRRSTLEWSSGARFGETVEAYVDALSLGRSSLVLRFTLTAAGRRCCVVETTYVWTSGGRSAPWPEHLRAAVSTNLLVPGGD